MTSQTSRKIIRRLQSLVPTNNLSEHDIELIVSHATLKPIAAGGIVFNEGDTDGYAFYLLDGELEFISKSNASFQIASNTDDARYPLVQFQPRQYTAKAIKKSLILLIDRALLDSLLVGNQAENNVDDDDDEVDNDEDWMSRIVQTPLYTKLSVESIQKILSKVEAIDVKRNEVVIKQGEEGGYYYIIQSGRCQISRKPNPESEDIHIAYLRAGDAFGEESIITNLKRSASVKMLSNGRLMRLSKKDFKELVLSDILKKIDLESANKRVKKGAVLLDVRYPDEYKEYAVENSINIPLNLLRTKVSELDSSKQYITCCDTSIRGTIAAYILAQNGYDVLHLDTGLKDILKSDKMRLLARNEKVKRSNSADILPFNENSELKNKTRASVHSNQPNIVFKDEIIRLREELNGIKEQFSEMDQIKDFATVLKKEIINETGEWFKAQQEKIGQQIVNASKLIQQAHTMYKSLEQDKKSMLNEIEDYKKKQKEEILNLRQELNKQFLGEAQEQEEPEQALMIEKTDQASVSHKPASDKVSSDLKQWMFEQAADSLLSVNSGLEKAKKKAIGEADRRRAEKTAQVAKKYEQELKTAKLRDYKLVSDIDKMIKKPDNN